jgi:hypothetical protein
MALLEDSLSADRAQRALPEEPQFHRALNDDLLVEVLQRIAVRLSYGLR